MALDPDIPAAMRRTFSPTISLGNLLTILGGVVALYAMTIRSDERIASQGAQILDLKADIAKLEAGQGADRERVRTEIGSLSRDVRDMTVRFARVEALLTRIVDEGQPPRARD